MDVRGTSEFTERIDQQGDTSSPRAEKAEIAAKDAIGQQSHPGL